MGRSKYTRFKISVKKINDEMIYGNRGVDSDTIIRNERYCSVLSRRYLWWGQSPELPRADKHCRVGGGTYVKQGVATRLSHFIAGAIPTDFPTL